MSDTSKLRFAAIIRVSTEKQEQEGASLRLQKTEIESAVKHLGGTVVAWYGGQEHATPGYEKKEVDRLVCDAQKTPKPFDAVIVTNADRWSRDNRKSREGLDVFKAHNIQFFTGTTSHDLIKPETRLILGMFAEMGQFYAANQKDKSIKARIHRAERGLATCGKVPYGRVVDENTGELVIDKRLVAPFGKTKQEIIVEVAKRYLAGEKLSNLAEEFKMNHANLHKVLTKRCGDAWEIKFHVKDLKIDKTVPMKMPRLLPDNIIDAIHRKAEAGKTYQHGQPKYIYLLSRMVFCKHCGYAMPGQRNHSKLQYYRHPRERDKECTQSKTWVRADQLENMVMLHLFECFGNPQAVQKAIEQAIPNHEKIKEAEIRIKSLDESLKKIARNREELKRQRMQEIIEQEEFDNGMRELNEKKNRLMTEREQLLSSISNRPDPDKVKEISKKVSAHFRKRVDAKLVAKKRLANHEYELMTDKEKRALVEMVFGGKTLDGRRMGVYIEWNEEGWKYNIHGHLIDKEGLLPMSDLEKEILAEQFGMPHLQKNLLGVGQSALY